MRRTSIVNNSLYKPKLLINGLVRLYVHMCCLNSPRVVGTASSGGSRISAQRHGVLTQPETPSASAGGLYTLQNLSLSAAGILQLVEVVVQAFAADLIT